MSNINIEYGLNSLHVPEAGNTVQQVRQKYEGVLNLPDAVCTQVNGHSVEDDYVLKEGDDLTFEREASKKG